MRQQELLRYRGMLEAQLSTIAQHTATAVHELVDDAAELPDPNDRATRETQIDDELRMRERDRQLIPLIQAALARIEAGTFGQCVSCGADIDPGRLAARPITALCIDCMRETERAPRLAQPRT